MSPESSVLFQGRGTGRLQGGRCEDREAILGGGAFPVASV